MSFTYPYPRPAVTVDIIVIRSTSEAKVLLIKRKNEPFEGCWALPGGFVDVDEGLKDAAYRELFEETALKKIYLEQFYTFGDKGRDPRGHNVSIVFWGYNDGSEKAVAGDDASHLEWFDLFNLPPLAFDHKEVIEKFKAEYF